MLFFLSSLFAAEPSDLRSVERTVAKQRDPLVAASALVTMLKDRTLQPDDRSRVRLALGKSLHDLELHASAMAQLTAAAKEGSNTKHHTDAMRHVVAISAQMGDYHDLFGLLEVPTKRPGKPLARTMAWLGCEDGAHPPDTVAVVSGWKGLVAAEADELQEVLNGAPTAFVETTGGWLQRQHDALATDQPRRPQPSCR